MRHEFRLLESLLLPHVMTVPRFDYVVEPRNVRFRPVARRVARSTVRLCLALGSLFTICGQDELQIPSTLRPKLATMDPTVKAAFLKSSQALAQMKPASGSATLSPRTLRRVLSSDSTLSSPRPQKLALQEYDLADAPRSPFGTGHSRGMSLDARRQTVESSGAAVAPLKVTKDKKKSAAITPEKYVRILLGQSSTAMDIEVVKKLRLLLRNESAR